MKRKKNFRLYEIIEADNKAEIILTDINDKGEIEALRWYVHDNQVQRVCCVACLCVYSENAAMTFASGFVTDFSQGLPILGKAKLPSFNMFTPVFRN